MSVNGIAGYSQLDAYKTYAKADKTNDKTTEKAADKTPAGAADEVAAVYEKSEEASRLEVSKGELATAKFKPNAQLIEAMKAEQQAVTNKLLGYVKESLMGQGNALASSDDMWRFLASGNYTVSEEAKAEAEKAIGEGGFYSAEKTSDRLLEFAKGLTGGDPEMIEKMRDAVKQGFEEAKGVWGKDLPGLCSDTYDMTMKKFDQWAEEAGLNTVTE